MRTLKNANCEYINSNFLLLIEDAEFLSLTDQPTDQEQDKYPSQLVIKDLSLLVQVAPPARQIGRQEATAWQVGWL